MGCDACSHIDHACIISYPQLFCDSPMGATMEINIQKKIFFGGGGGGGGGGGALKPNEIQCLVVCFSLICSW